MLILLTILHITVCVFLILVVLLQTGKGADLAGAFGGAGSQTAFGARGATTLLHKLTTISAIMFMITSFALAMMGNRLERSVVTDEPARQSQPVVPPATEQAPPPAPGPTGGTAPEQPGGGEPQ